MPQDVSWRGCVCCDSSGRYRRWIAGATIHMAKLIFIDQRFAGRVYELVLEKTTVGRGDQNTLTIRDRSLSASHCEILTYGSEVIVRDLNSRNGTFVQGVRLNQQSQVKSGQTV